MFLLELAAIVTCRASVGGIASRTFRRSSPKMFAGPEPTAISVSSRLRRAICVLLDGLASSVIEAEGALALPARIAPRNVSMKSFGNLGGVWVALRWARRRPRRSTTTEIRCRSLQAMLASRPSRILRDALV